uniref:fibronectin type III domain-containing protein n=1 Tax=Paractinoplanes polyasparticus TaxID=2856853 RepID=UPI001C861C04|nr:fibronectin type III domain-containing protein [Actinoplanes polyasparticus]
MPSSGGAHPGTLRGEPVYPSAPGSGGPYTTTPGESYPHGSGYSEAPGAGQVFAPAYPSGGAGPYAQASDSPAGRKGLGVFAAVAAVLAAVIAVAALVFVLANRTSDSSDNDNVPTLAGPPPTDVRLRDTGATVDVNWTDPTQATVSFMVIMGRPGQELKPVGTVGPGQTSFEMTGLNATVNYCFAVVAVYSGNQFATSPQACTSRASATPR